MTQVEYVHIHLALSPDLAQKLDALAKEWKLKRPLTIERMVEKEYKAIMRKQAQPAPKVEVTE